MFLTFTSNFKNVQMQGIIFNTVYISEPEILKLPPLIKFTC